VDPCLSSRWIYLSAIISIWSWASDSSPETGYPKIKSFKLLYDAITHPKYPNISGCGFNPLKNITTNQILSFWSWWQISWYPHFWLIQPTSNATPPPEGPAAGRPKQVPCKPEPCRAFSKPLAVNGQQACHGEMMWDDGEFNGIDGSFQGDSVICNWYIADKWNINVSIYINIYILIDITYP